jgi:DnaK suppressor protein
MPREQASEPAPPPRPNEAETSEPIEAEAYGEIIEVPPDATVDGDYNGAPELAGLAETHQWEGVDALDALRGADAQSTNVADDDPAAERAYGLHERRAEILERLEELAGGATGDETDDLPEAPPQGEDELDAAGSTREALLARLQRVDAALERLEDGEYGLCLACGAEIAEARLDETPEIETCEACADADASR